MNRNGRIQICMIAYTTYSVDGRIRREAETLAANRKFGVRIISLKEGIAARCYSMQGVEVMELNVSKYFGRNYAKYLISYLKFMMQAFLLCSKMFFRREINVIHVHNMPDFMVFAALLPRLARKKVVLDIHDTMPETYAARTNMSSRALFHLFRFEEAICCAFAHRVICVNHVQSDTLIRRGIAREKLFISMNVPDHKKFNTTTLAKSRTKDEPFRIVYHGTMTERLGIDLVIHAAHHLVREIPSLELYLFGIGADLEEFVALTKSLRAGKYVHFNKKVVPIEQLIPLLREMNVGVVPNRRSIATELMLPVKLVEYVAMDIPVVVPRLKTIAHYFTSDMVSFFEPGDVRSLVNAIRSVYMNDSKCRQQIVNARSFLKTYGWERQQHSLINFYETLA